MALEPLLDGKMVSSIFLLICVFDVCVLCTRRRQAWDGQAGGRPGGHWAIFSIFYFILDGYFIFFVCSCGCCSQGLAVSKTMGTIAVGRPVAAYLSHFPVLFCLLANCSGRDWKWQYAPWYR